MSPHLFIPVSLSHTQSQASCRCLDAHFCLHQPLLLHPFHPPPSLSHFPVYQAAVQVHVQQNRRLPLHHWILIHPNASCLEKVAMALPQSSSLRLASFQADPWLCSPTSRGWLSQAGLPAEGKLPSQPLAPVTGSREAGRMAVAHLVLGRQLFKAQTSLLPASCFRALRLRASQEEAWLRSSKREAQN